MNFILSSVQRPIATTLLAFGVALSGIIAFHAMPVSPLPQVEFPTISIQASLPGGSPEVMATSVATPLERQLGRISGITEMTSSSSLGMTKITVQFDLARDINGAARDVQAAINAARSQLPSNLPNNPTYRIVNPADSPIMIIALTSDIYSKGQMYDVASTILQQKLSQINGVGQVIVGGSSLPAVRVELNPTILTKYGISLNDVGTALKATNTNKPKGQINDEVHAYEIMTNDQIFKAYQYKPLIITYRNGAAVKLSDLGDVEDSVEDIKNAGLANGKPSVLLIVFKQPGMNIIETVDRVYSLIPQLKASIPAAIDMFVPMDRTATIRASLRDVEFTLLAAIVLVILVIYKFLGNIRAAVIPSVVVPLSLLGTFGIMCLCGYSLNNLSLMALTIVTGFVVDDAVVVLENISRHIEAGMKPIKAAMQGAMEVGFTVLSMSISLVAVFIPILLMNGIIGRLFREFAMTMTIAILVSMVVSLTVTPMMSAQLLKTKNKKSVCDSGVIHFLKTHYKSSLRWALNHSRLMLLVTLATVGLNIFLYVFISKGFFPQQDTGRIMGSIQAQQNISFQALKHKLSAFDNIIQKDPAVESVTGYVGGMNSSGNAGSVYISLKPLEMRKVSAEVVLNRLRKKLAVVSGATLYLKSAQDLVIGGKKNSAQFQYTLSAYDTETLKKWVPRIMAKFAKIPGVVDVNSDQLDHGLQVYITIDRDTASRFRITPQQIDNTLYSAFGQRQISTMYTSMNQYHVVMTVAQKYWQQPETLDNIYVASSSGKQVPLSAFSKFSPSSTLLIVNHQNQFPATTLSFNLLPGFALGDIVIAVKNIIDEMQLPAGSIKGSFQGTAKAFQESLASQPYLILAALLAVYIVLGILYESIIHPITILSTLPSAGVGAILALLITGNELNIISLIGILLLIGIVKKNAIMMIDFALDIKRTQGKSSYDAIFEACLLRFRPIMMTTMAAMLSALPLAFGVGVGAELRQPLGIAIIGGLLVSQVITLYTTPVIYLSLERCSDWVSGWQAHLSRILFK